MGEQAETSPRQNIQAHTASWLRQTERPTPCTPDYSLHPNLLTWFSPPPSHLTSLFPSFSLSDSPGTVKSSELSGGMSDDCVEQSTKHTHATYTVPHTYTHTFHDTRSRTILTLVTHNPGLGHTAPLIIINRIL